MGFRFRKSFKIAPGVRVNFGTRGGSLTLGGRGASINIGSRGVYGNVGIPGTGISFRERLDRPAGRSSSPQDTVDLDVKVSLDDDGQLQVRDKDGQPLPPGLEHVARRELGSSLRPWLEEQARDINRTLEVLPTLHLATPAPTALPPFVPEPFTEPAPAAPILEEPGFLIRCLPFLRARYDAGQAFTRKRYESDRAEWEDRKARHEDQQASRRRLADALRQGELPEMEARLAQLLEGLEWPRETSVSFELLDAMTLYLDVDLPEVEDMPAAEAQVAARGDRLLMKPISETNRRKHYMQHVHGIAFRLVGEAFAALPTLQTVVISGYSQRPDKKTGHVQDDYLYSARVDRSVWSSINFQNLAALDVVEAFERFELRRLMTKTGVFKPIEPYSLPHSAAS